MLDEKQTNALSDASTDVAASGRKPYNPPAIDEEEMIENVAMSASVDAKC